MLNNKSSEISRLHSKGNKTTSNVRFYNLNENICNRFYRLDSINIMNLSVF